MGYCVVQASMLGTTVYTAIVWVLVLYFIVLWALVSYTTCMSVLPCRTHPFSHCLDSLRIRHVMSCHAYVITKQINQSTTVSGLWGILYFHEVKGAATIAKWFLSAFITVSGILLLSYEPLPQRETSLQV